MSSTLRPRKAFAQHSGLIKRHGAVFLRLSEPEHLYRRGRPAALAGHRAATGRVWRSRASNRWRGLASSAALLQAGRAWRRSQGVEPGPTAMFGAFGGGMRDGEGRATGFLTRHVDLHRFGAQRRARLAPSGLQGSSAIRPGFGDRHFAPVEGGATGYEQGCCGQCASGRRAAGDDGMGQRLSNRARRGTPPARSGTRNQNPRRPSPCIEAMKKLPSLPPSSSHWPPAFAWTLVPAPPPRRGSIPAFRSTARNRAIGGPGRAWLPWSTSGGTSCATCVIEMPKVIAT